MVYVRDSGSGRCEQGAASRTDDESKEAAGVCGCGVADTDTDTDGTPDCIDGCPNDELKTEPGACGCGPASRWP